MRAIGVLVLVAVLLPSAAHADDGSIGTDVTPRGDPVVYVSEPGADPIGGPSGSGNVVCHLYNVTGVFVGSNVFGLGVEPEQNPEEGHGYLLVCSSAPSGDILLVDIITYEPGVNIITPGSLAQQALKELPLLYPRPRLAPPTTAVQVTGIRTWMWVDPADWHPISATAAIPGLAATVTATPTRTIWDMGDGSVVTCDGPGTVYDRTRPDADQQSDCSHVYQHASDDREGGTYPVRVSIVWSVTWNATNGDGGSLGLFQRSTQFTVTVEQRQAVING